MQASSVVREVPNLLADGIQARTRRCFHGPITLHRSPLHSRRGGPGFIANRCLHSTQMYFIGVLVGAIYEYNHIRCSTYLPTYIPGERFYEMNIRDERQDTSATAQTTSVYTNTPPHQNTWRMPRQSLERHTYTVVHRDTMRKHLMTEAAADIRCQACLITSIHWTRPS